MAAIGRAARRNARTAGAHGHADGASSRASSGCSWRGLLREGLSPDQISGRFHRDGTLRVSHETIYQYIWADKRAGGHLYLCLRQHTRRRRKRYATKERRGRVSGKRHISDRPAAANERREFGHWEIDTVHGSGRDSVVTLVERLTGVVLIGKLPNLSAAALNRRVLLIIRRFERKHARSSRPSLPTTEPSSTATQPLSERLVSSSTSPRPTTPGSAVPTRTPTA